MSYLLSRFSDPIFFSQLSFILIGFLLPAILHNRISEGAAYEVIQGLSLTVVTCHCFPLLLVKSQCMHMYLIFRIRFLLLLYFIV